MGIMGDIYAMPEIYKNQQLRNDYFVSFALSQFLFLMFITLF